MTTALNPGVRTTTADTQSNAADADTPAFAHPGYTRTQARRKKCRDLFDGTPAIRDGRELYLTRLANESDESYDFRLMLCAVFNGFQRTVKASVGLILEKDPELGDDMPANLKAFAEDVDLKGTHLSVYAERTGIDGVIDGYVGSLVDVPADPNPSGRSAADESQNNFRPYFARYLAADVLQVRFGKINGALQKTLVVLREVVEEVVGQFQIVETTRYKVYRHTTETGVTWEQWKTDAADSVTTIEFKATPMKGKGQKPLTRIPFSLFAPGEQLGLFEFIPPLENLADLNIEHHQVKTNIRNLETLAFVPTQVRIGATSTVDEDGKLVYPEITLGPRHTIEAPATPGVSTPVYWHQPSVDVLEPGNRSLQDIKSDMGSAGLAFLTPDKRAAETLGAKRLDSAAQNATVSSVSRKLQDHLEELFQFAGEYTGDVSGSITMNRDFENTVMDSSMVTALSNLKANGGLSIDTLLVLLERGSVLPEGFNREDEIRKILTENQLPPENTAAA